MLPVPGSASASWAMYRARFAAIFQDASPRVTTAFWLLGLINNVLYVIILSAALDLVGPTIPKGIVLLCNIFPGLLVKIIAPHILSHIPYAVRTIALATISILGMLLVSLTPAYTDLAPAQRGSAAAIKMVGVALGSVSSAGGEVTFLALTHFYGPWSLAGWGSGTGAAGLIGAGVYALATTVLELGSRATLFASAFMPVVLLIAFFGILPLGPLKQSGRGHTRREPQYVDDTPGEENALGTEEDRDTERHGLLGQTQPTHSSAESTSQQSKPGRAQFIANLRQMRSLFLPYMLPLLLVYVAEYTINQGLSPVLLFPLESSPFKDYRSFYPTYAFLYQVGVFVSRSSTPFIRLQNLYLPSLLQCLNLGVLVAQAMMPSLLGTVWIVFAIMFWEGLLGGAVYVNTFAKIAEEVRPERREFSLGAVSVSDSSGICLAGIVASAVEVGLCAWQVNHLGRPWCRQL